MVTAGFMKQCNASKASYLFQPDKLNAEYDLGDKTIQCGRRADAFKLWLAWKVGAAASRNSRCPLFLSCLSSMLHLEAWGLSCKSVPVSCSLSFATALRLLPDRCCIIHQ